MKLPLPTRIALVIFIAIVFVIAIVPRGGNSRAQFKKLCPRIAWQGWIFFDGSIPSYP